MQKYSRFWEIDFFRGLAIAMMVVFNYAFALSYLRVFQLDAGWLFWWFFPRAIASMFIFIAGVSFTISYVRTKKKNVWRKYAKRGLKIFSLGLLATATTWLFFPEGTIYFGILHFLGVAIMIAPFLHKLGRSAWVAGIAAIVTGIALQSFSVSFPWLLWLGLAPQNFRSFDYFPLLPWLGVFLLGIYAGGRLYGKGRRNFTLNPRTKTTRPLEFLGRHSLLIYVLHQPLLLALLYAAGFPVI